MERNIMWTPWSVPGLQYEITCDSNWNVKELGLALLSGNRKGIKIRSDGQGRWSTHMGDSVPSLEGCIDVDISATPFTNTLPIRRLKLSPGQSVELLVAYVLVPEMELMLDRQRYTSLESYAHGALYRYESLESDFSAELPVDSDGLVLDYPDLFKSVWRSEVKS